MKVISNTRLSWSIIIYIITLNIIKSVGHGSIARLFTLINEIWDDVTIILSLAYAYVKIITSVYIDVLWRYL